MFYIQRRIRADTHHRAVETSTKVLILPARRAAMELLQMHLYF